MVREAEQGFEVEIFACKLDAQEEWVDGFCVFIPSQSVDYTIRISLYPFHQWLKRASIQGRTGLKVRNLSVLEHVRTRWCESGLMWVHRCIPHSYLGRIVLKKNIVDYWLVSCPLYFLSKFNPCCQMGQTGYLLFFQDTRPGVAVYVCAEVWHWTGWRFKALVACNTFWSWQFS